MASPFLYFADDVLSAAELTAACLDGHLISLGEGFVPADTVETAALRAGSLAPLLGTSMAATLQSAAWVHGVLDEPPPRHDVQRISEKRLKEPVDRRFIYRDPQVPASDLLQIGGVAVTTLARTVADLARGTDPDYAALLRRFVVADVAAVAAGAEWMRRVRRIPRRLQALAHLEQLLRTR